ncbi:MAG: acyl-CoA dehydrogenase family protein, partial [Lapillicoccus sp.]
MPAEEARDLIDLTRDICAGELAHRVDAADAAGEFPRETYHLLGKAGLLSLPYP